MSLDVNIESEEFNCIELHSCVQDLAGILGISDFEYNVDHISGGGRENFIANIFRVAIRDIEKDNSISVIVKTLVNTIRQDLFHDLHKREVDVYEQIIPKFREIQDKLEDVQRIWFPECLFSSAEMKKEVIILKDLNEIGFTPDNTLVEYKELSYDKVQLIMTELAKFHGLSIVYKNENKEDFKRIKHYFVDLMFQEKFLKTKLKNYFYESFDMSLSLVTDLDIKKNLEKVRPRLLDILKFYHKPTKHNVLCHGDLWLNNLLFKQDGDHCKVCFLDFQAMRYTSPVNDIIYFIYLCTTSQFRSENLQKLLDVYYDSLKSFLNVYDIDVNTVYPKEDFDEDIKTKLAFGLLISLIELRIITTTAEDDAIFKGGKIIPGSSLEEVPGEIDLFKYRVNDLVEECVNNGVLEQLLNKIKE